MADSRLTALELLIVENDVFTTLSFVSQHYLLKTLLSIDTFAMIKS